jgi:hypothetical protein
MAIIAIAAYMAGTLWSLFLVNTTKRVRNTIGGIVNSGNLLFIALLILSFISPSFHSNRWFDILHIPFYFNLFTSVLLNSPPPAEGKKATS